MAHRRSRIIDSDGNANEHAHGHFHEHADRVTHEHPNRHADEHADRYVDEHFDQYSDDYPDGDTVRHSNAHFDAHEHAHEHADGDPDIDTYSNTDADSHQHTDTRPDAGGPAPHDPNGRHRWTDLAGEWPGPGSSHFLLRARFFQATLSSTVVRYTSPSLPPGYTLDAPPFNIQ